MENRSQNFELDNLDTQILCILMEDATIPYTEIAKKLIVSGGTIHVRMKKMHDMGVIKGSHLIIDPQKIGYDICAFLGIYLEKGSQYKDAVENLKKIKNPRIERTIETRQLILKGRLLDRLIKNGQVTEDVFKSALSEFLIKDTDRELFGLAIINIEPVAETAVSANNNSQQLLTIQSYDPQRRDEAIEAIENMTDYMDMEGIDNIDWLIDNLPRTILLHAINFTELEFSLQALNAAGCVAILSKNQNHDLN